MIEMLIVISVSMIVTGVGTMTMLPIMRSIQASNAFNTTLGTLRYARQLAIGKRNVYMVTLDKTTVPNKITITDTNPTSPGVIETVTLPKSVSFDNEPGIPNSVTTSPDGFGAGANAIDFAQAPATGANNVIYFYPDGSARDISSNVNNGVVYIARSGDLMSSRAISLWGATGRLRGWYLTNSGTLKWSQQ
jgi:Tfp pilus assembly protein FimT